MKEWWNVLWIEWIYWLLNLEWKWPLGEHGGSGDVQGFDQERKEVEWNGKKCVGRRTGILTWTGRLCTVGQLAVSQQVHFGQPTANRVQFGSIYRNVFCDRESSVSFRPTDELNLGRPTANRGKFGSISRMVIFCQEIWRSAVSQLSVGRHSPTRLATGNRELTEFSKVDLLVGLSWD